MDKAKLTEIAIVFLHAFNGLLESNGHGNQKLSEDLISHELERVIKEIELCLESPKGDKESLHYFSIEKRINDGWKYGELLDRELKTDPFLMPFEDIPELHKKRLALFSAIVDALK